MTEDQLKILSETEKFVKEIFRKKLNPLFVFHNLAHTKQVVNAATEIAKHYQLNDDDKFVLLLAAWFHDTGFSTGHAEEHEKESIRLASNFLLQYTDMKIVSRVASCIMATRAPQSPQNLVEEIMCDADLYHLGTNKFRKMNVRLKKEQQAYFIKQFTTPTGSNGKILKSDVLEALLHPGRAPGKDMFTRDDKPEKMSNLRKTISRRLVEAKNTTAMLTTFNEVDMSAIMDIRTKYKEIFKTKHGVGLGFMSFFTKAVCFALQEWPAVNAMIDGDNIIYHNYCDISIAVSAPKGLVVPVIRNAESLSMAEIEKKVVELATKAKENKLTIEEMTGGTFTLTNGGVFGSLLSTPIINIPQSAILGMHKILERPVALNGQVVIKPMMYLAVSYDHRIIDGRESVSFLVRVKEMLESPEQLLFGKAPVKALLEL